MGHGLLHQSNPSGRIGAVLARSKDSHGLGEKVGVGGITLRDMPGEIKQICYT